MTDQVSLTSAVTPATDPKAHAAAKAFEAVFAGQMTKLMMESVQPDGTFTGGHGEAMFRGILAEQLGSQIAKGRGMGIADSVLAEIMKLQQAGSSGGQ